MAIQYFCTPKYAINIYAVVPADNLPLRILFCVHELMFMGHTYIYQAFTMVLAESFAVSYQHLLEEMNNCMKTILNQRPQRKPEKLVIGEKTKSAADSSIESPKSLAGSDTPPGKQAITFLSPNFVAPGTEYTLLGLLDDYKKITISAQFHNQWVGAIMGFPEALNCAQFVSDVFMMIQLLKEPEMDYFGVFLYVLDAAFGMLMLFRMLIILSRLYPQGQRFVQALKTYASRSTPLRKMLVKSIPGLRVVGAKLTGMTVRPESVPIGFNVLINWYIAAAMWKRPDDPSRRT